MDKPQQKNWLTYVLSPVTTIYKEEQPRAVIAFFAYLLLMASYYMIRPTRSTIFLKEWGWQAMPVFYLIIAVFTLFTTFGYNFFVELYSRSKLIRLVFLCVILSFLAFWGLYTLDYYPKETTIAWYIWVCIYILFLTSLFWSLNHDIHTAEQSRRLYPLILLGAQAGVYIGSRLTSLLLKKYKVGNYNLIFISALMLLAVWGLLEILSFFQKDAPKPGNQDSKYRQSLDDVRNLLENPYTLSIACIVVIGTFAFTLCDIQYKRMLSSEILAPWEYSLKDIKNFSEMITKIENSQDKPISLIRENLPASVSLQLKNYSFDISHEIQEKTSLLFLPLFPIYCNKKVVEIFLIEKNYYIFQSELNTLLAKISLVDPKYIETLDKQIQSKILETKDQGRANRLLLDVLWPDAIHKKRTLLEKDADEQSIFLAENDKIMAILNIIMLFIVAPHLLRLLGPGWAVLFYPIATMAATFAFLWGINIYTAAYFAIALAVLHYTLYLVGKEAFYVPTDKETKYKIKAIIDTFGYRLGDALGGGVSTVYLIFLSFIGSNFISGLGIFIFLAGFIWLPATLYAEKEYNRLTKK